MNLAHFSFGHTGPFPPRFLAWKSRFGLGFLTLVFATSVMRAPPTDGTVVGGTATITTGQNTTTITAGNNSVLRWGSFDVGSAEVVQFIQPGADARVLNWIGGRTPSQIDGSLLANGQVYLVNPAGVYFGQTAVVDVGRLYAIGGSLSREDFLAGLNRFSSLTGDVRNDGTLRGSSVALVGRTVLNTGSIVAPGGFVALAAGEQVVLGQNGSSIFVDAGHTTSGAAPQVTTTPGVANSGTIDAGGGSVVLAAGDLYAVAITQDGKLTARDVKLQGQGGGDVLVSGTINASATGAGETGGNVEITGNRVGLLASAQIDASGPAGGGTILVGGDLHGANPDVRNATATTVMPGVTLNADATQAGNGGKVVVWSNDTTRYFGNLSARGGPLGGNGGFAEVSGKEQLVFRGGADVGSVGGRSGTILLDPRDLSIVAAGTDDASISGSTFSFTTPDRNTDATITNTIVEALTGNVILQADRDLTVAVGAPLNFSNVATTSVLFEAGRSIAINDTVVSNGATLAFTANSAGGNQGAGAPYGGTPTITVSAGIGDANTGAVSFTNTGAGGIVLGANVTSSETQSYTGAVTLGADATLTGTTLTLGSTLAGGTHDLNLAFSGGNTVDGAVITGVKNLATSVGATTLTGAVTTTGTQTYNTAATLGADTTLTSTGAGAAGNITFNAAVSGGSNLTVNTAGTTAFNSTATGLTSLTTDAAGTTAINGGLVTSTGAQTYNDAVTLGFDTVMTSTGNNAVTFGSTLNGAYTLTVNTGGLTTFGGAVGNTAALISLTTDITGTTTINGGSINTAGAQTYNDAVTLGADTTLTGTTLTLGSTLTGGTHDLNLAFSGGNVVDGAVIGGVKNLSTSSGATTLTGAITTTGTQTYNTAVTLNGNTTLATTNSAVIFGNTVDSSTGDNRNLTTSTGSAAPTFAAAVGGVAGGQLGTFSITNTAAGGTILPAVNVQNLTLNLGGSLTSTGLLTATNAINLQGGGNVGSSGTLLSTATPVLTLSKSGGNTFVSNTGALGLSGTIAGDLNVSNDAAINFAGTLNAGGNTVRLVAVGGVTQGSGNILTAGSASFNNSGSSTDINLPEANGIGTIAASNSGNNGNVVVRSDRAGGLTVDQVAAAGPSFVVTTGIQANHGDITVTNTLGGITVNQNVTSTGGSGGAVSIDGAVLTGSAVVSTGSRNVTFDANATDTVINGTISSGNLVLSANQDIIINGTLNSTSAGTLTLTADADSNGTGGVLITNLGRLNAPSLAGTLAITGSNIQNTGNVGGAGLGRGYLFYVDAGGRVSAPHDITVGPRLGVGSASNIFIFGDGTNAALTTTGGSITLDPGTGGTTTLNGGGTTNPLLSASGSLLFPLRPVALTGATLLTSTGSGAVTFDSTVSGTQALAVNTGGVTTFSGTVSLASLTTDAPGTTAINGGSVTTTGTQTYNDAVTLGADTTLTGISATFGSTVGGGGTARALTLAGSTNGTFGGAVGGTGNFVSNLSVSGTTAINGLAVNTTGTQSYTGILTLGADTTLTGTTLTLGSTLTGGTHDLNLAFSGGNVVDGAVITGVKNLSTSVGATTLTGAVTTTGTQTYNTATTLSGDTTLTGTSATFGSTVGGGGTARALTLAGATNGRFDGAVGGTGNFVSNLSVGGTTAINGLAVNTTGTQSYTGILTLGADTTLTGTTLTLGSTLTGGTHDLNLAFSGGNVVNGAVITGVKNLSTSVGATTLTGAVTTTGTQTYNTATTLSSDTTLTGTSATFGSTVGGGGTARSLALAGATNGRFDGAVGGVGNFVSNLSVGGTTAINGLAVNTAGTQSYTGAVTLGADTTLTGINATFGSTVGGGGTARALTLAGATNGTFDGAVGGTGNFVSNLSVSGTTAINGLAVNTTGTQSYTGILTLGADTTLTGTTLTLGSTLTGGTHDLNLAFSGGNVVDGAVITGVKNLSTSVGATTLTGAVTTTGTQTYNTATTLSGDTTLTGTSATFGSTVGGGGTARALTLAGATNGRFDGAVGGTGNFVSNLSVGGTTAINGLAVNTTGTQSYTGILTLGADTTLTGTTLTLGSTLTGGTHDLNLAFSGGNVVNGAVITGVKNLSTSVGATTLTGAVTTTGTQTYNTATTLSSDTTLTGTSATFGSTVGGGGTARSLALAGATNGRFDGAVGGVGNFVSNLSVGGTTAINGLAVNTAGTQSYTGAVTLGADTTLTGINATFGSTVGGGGTARALTLAGATNGTFDGAVGGTSNLVSSLSVGGTTALNSLSVTTTDTQTYTGILTLGAPVATLTGTTPTFTAGVAGGGNDLRLSFTGMTAIDGAKFTGIKNLASDNTGTTSLTGAVTTTGTQTYTDAVTLAGPTTLAAGANLVQFGSTVNGGQTLAITGAGGARFDDVVGGTPLTSLAVTGATALNGASVTTTGAQTYTGILTLGAPVATLTGTTPTFTAGVAGGGNDLRLSFTGTTAIDGAKFTGIKNLASDNTGTTSLTGAITTTGTQTYTDAVTLAGPTTLAAGANLVRFGSTVDGGQTLAIMGAGGARFDDMVGGTPLTSLAVTGATALNGTSVTTTGAQTYTGTLTLGANTTLASTGNAAISLNGAVDADLAANNRALTVNTAGATIFGSAVGGVQSLGSLTTNAGGTVSLRNVTTTGTQSYGENATLNGTYTTTDGAFGVGGTTSLAGDTLVSTGTGAVTFSGAVDADLAANNRALTVNTAGATTFASAVGGTQRLGSLTTDAGGTVSLRSVTTTGAQSYGENATLNGTYTTTNGAFGVGGTTSLAGDTLVSTGTGAVTFTGAVDADLAANNRALTVNTAGATTFASAVGGTQRLGSLTTDAGGTVSLRNVTTTGLQSYGENATLNGTYTTTNGAFGVGGTTSLAGDTLVSTGTGAVTFSGAVDADLAANNRALTVNTAGATIFGSAVGGVQSLGSLTTNAGGTVSLRNVTTTGTQSYGENATLNGTYTTTDGAFGVGGTTSLAGDTLVSTGTGAVTFSGAVDADLAANNRALTVNTAGATTFASAVGGTQRLGSLTTDAGGTVSLRSVTTTGAQSYGENATLNGTYTTTNGAFGVGGTTSLAGDTLVSTGTGAVTFTGAVDADLAANNRALTVNTTGATIFGSAVGGVQSLGSLTTNAGGTVSLRNVTTTGTQTYGDAVTLGANTTLSTTNSLVNFGSTVDSNTGGNFDLTISTGNATTLFGGSVGGTHGLGMLTVTNTAAAGVALPAVTAQILNVTTGGPVTDFGDLTIAGAATINAGANAITLGDTTTANFGSLALTGGTVNVREGSATNLTAVNANTLTLASAGALTFTGGPITVTGDASFTAGGDITDTPGTTLGVGGLASFNAGANNITLGDSAGDTTNFGRLNVTGGVVDITEDSSMIVSGTASNITLHAVGIDLAGLTIPGSLYAYSTGPITASADTNVFGSAVLYAADGAGNYFDINLGSHQNDFNIVQLTGDNVVLSDVNSVILQDVLARGDFSARAGTSLTVNTALNGSHNVSLAAVAGDVTLNSGVSSSGGSVVVTASQNVVQNAGGAITVTAPSGNATVVAGAGSVTMDPAATTTVANGTITYSAGANATLANLVTSGGTVAVTAGGNARFIDPLVISGPFGVTAGSPGVTFDQVINGNVGGTTANLKVNTSGPMVFSQAVGRTTALTSLTTDAGGTTAINGGSITTTGSQTYNDAVTLGAGTTLASTGSGTIAFNGTLDGTFALTVNTAGMTSFGDGAGNDWVGSTAPLASLTTDAPGTTVFNVAGSTATNPTVKTTGTQTYNDAVTLGAGTVLTSTGSSAVTFVSTINGAQALSVNTGGVTTFDGAVGNTTALASLTTDAAGTTVFNVAGSTTTSPTVKTTGAQVYNDAVTLAADTVLNSTAGNLTLQQAVTGQGKALTLIGPQGTVTAAADLGAQNARLASVSATGRNLIIGSNIWTNGDILLALGTNAGTAGTPGTANDYLQFNNTGETANRATRIDSATGNIVLGSGAVSGSSAKTGAPLRSSIYKNNPGDLYLFGSNVEVKPFERLAVSNGSLVVIADGTAAGQGKITLSNTAVSNYLVLVSSAPLDANAPGIRLNSRGPADIDLGPRNPPGQDHGTDLGTDLVAGAVLMFNTNINSSPSPTRTPTATAKFIPSSTPGPTTDPSLFDYASNKGNVLTSFGPAAVTILPDASGVTHTVFIADLLTTNPFRPFVPNLVYLDLSTASGFGVSDRDQFINFSSPTFGLTGVIPIRSLVSTGAQVRNAVEQAFTPAVPREDIQAAAPEADLAAAVREQLQALGVYARPLDRLERLSRERRAGLFVTVPPRERPREADYEVADARVEDRAVREVIRLATETGLIGEGQGRLDEVARALAATFEAFSAAVPSGDGRQFRTWLEARSDPNAKSVLDFAKSLQSTLKKIELLGLTRQELEGSKAQIYGSVLRSRLNAEPEFIRAFVEGLPPAANTAILWSPSTAVPRLAGVAAVPFDTFLP